MPYQRGVGGRRLHAPAAGREPRARQRRARAGDRRRSSATASRCSNEPDGLHGSFKIHENGDGDKALSSSRRASWTASRSRRARDDRHDSAPRASFARQGAPAGRRLLPLPRLREARRPRRPRAGHLRGEVARPHRRDGRRDGRALPPARDRATSSATRRTPTKRTPPQPRTPPRSAPASPAEATTRSEEGHGRNTERAQARPPDRRARDRAPSCTRSCSPTSRSATRRR